MLKGARRLAMRLWQPPARRALMLICLWLAGAEAALACRDPSASWRGEVPDTGSLWPLADGSDTIKVSYADLSARYGHGVLGDALEPTTLLATSNTNSPSCGSRIKLDTQHVFEDTAPRLVDLTGDGLPEIITVRSHAAKGAQLAIYALDAEYHQLSLLVTTPYIGTRYRWLAPLGAADLDGDGRMEIAYVDRPHLAKTLRIWRFNKGDLREVGFFPGVTNHRIGEEDIAGGIRTCGGVPEMILADAAWQSLLALRFDGKDITLRQIGIDTSLATFADAMGCSGG
jgi:hypothetical protein